MLRRGGLLAARLRAHRVATHAVVAHRLDASVSRAPAPDVRATIGARNTMRW